MEPKTHQPANNNHLLVTLASRSSVVKQLHRIAFLPPKVSNDVKKKIIKNHSSNYSSVMSKLTNRYVTSKTIKRSSLWQGIKFCRCRPITDFAEWRTNKKDIRNQFQGREENNGYEIQCRLVSLDCHMVKLVK